MNRSVRLLTVSFCLFVLSTITVSPINAKGRNITVDKNDQKTTIACTGSSVATTTSSPVT